MIRSYEYASARLSQHRVLYLDLGDGVAGWVEITQHLPRRWLMRETYDVNIYVAVARDDVR